VQNLRPPFEPLYSISGNLPDYEKDFKLMC